MDEPADVGADELPPPQQGLSEIDAVEAELRKVTPHLATELSNLFEELKGFGLTTRLVIAEFAKTRAHMAELLCRSALAGPDGDEGGIKVLIGAAALLSRLGQVGATSEAPRGSSACKLPVAKRAKKEAMAGQCMLFSVDQHAFAPLWHFAQSDGSFTFISKW